MLKYLLYLVIYLQLQLIAYILTPILPLFKVLKYGNQNNQATQGISYRLPKWLSWFDTPDNGLEGDERWLANNPTTYWSMVRWLYRNSLYGFKWSVLAAPMVADARFISGNTSIDWGITGICWIEMNNYWQFKLCFETVKYKYNLNFGWLLNNPDQEKALFMFSPRRKAK